MTIENSEIALLIQKARKEKNVGQKQLAQRLQKTIVAISDIERGKVKISAAELSIIAEILSKPIEYFYGEDIGDEEIRDMVSILRKTSPEQRKEQLTVIKNIVEMQQAQDIFMSDPEREPTSEEARRFTIAFLNFRAYINDLSGQINGMAVLLEQSLKAQGIELPKKPQ